MKRCILTILVFCLVLCAGGSGCATFQEAAQSTERAEEIAAVVYQGLTLLEAIAASRGATEEQLDILRQVRELVREYELGFATINDLNEQAMPLLTKALATDVPAEVQPHTE